MKPHSRKLLQDEDDLRNILSPSVTYSPDPLLQPINSSSSTLKNGPFLPNSPFDSSMALTALVLLTALFFMGFLSIYIRRFTDERAGEVSTRRRGRPPYLSSSLPPWRRSNIPKGLDPSAVLSLPLIPYRGAAKHPIDCAICLSQFEERETVKMIPYCCHVFHPECIDTWLSSHVSCPICRSTQMDVLDEVRLAVEQAGVVNHDVSEDQERSTVESGETCVEAAKDVGPVEMRRVSSCSSCCSGLGDRVVLQRSLSF